MGRPKKENPRSIAFRLRMTSDEKDMLSEISERTSMPMSEVVREAIELYYWKIKSPPDPRLYMKKSF